METPTPECSEETPDTPEFSFQNSSLDLLTTAALLKPKIMTTIAEEGEPLPLPQQNPMKYPYENYLKDMLEFGIETEPAEATEICTFHRMESMEAPSITPLSSDLEDELEFLDKIDLENKEIPIEKSRGYIEEVILEGEADVKMFNEVPENVQNENEEEKESKVQNNGQNYSPVTSPEAELKDNSPINLTVSNAAQEIPIFESEDKEDKKVKNKPKPSKRRGRTPKKKVGRPPGKKVKNSPSPTPTPSTSKRKRKDIMLLTSLGLTPAVETPKTPAELKNLAVKTPEYARDTPTPRRAATRNINYNEKFLVERNNQMTIMAHIQNKSTPTKKRGRKPKVRTNILNTIEDQIEENSRNITSAAAGNFTPDDASYTYGDIAEYLEPPAGTIATTTSSFWTAGVEFRNRSSVAGNSGISNGKGNVAGGSDRSAGEAEEALNLDQIDEFDDDDENVNNETEKYAGEEETETEEEYINTETEEETKSDKHLGSEEEEDFKYF